MRQRNLSMVMRAIADHGPLSRARIAEHVGLTRAAVSTLVGELAGAELLVELGRDRPGTVGRPGSALALSDRGPAGLGAEIGVDHLAVCAVDLRGEVRVKAEESAPNRDSSPSLVLGRLAGLVRRVADEAGAGGLRPAGLCVAVPGPVERGSTRVVRTPNLGWPPVDLGDALSGTLPEPVPMTVANEANLGALAELWIGGHGPGLTDFVHVSAEIGIGAAVVVDGELLRGAHGFAGELGHVPVRPEGLPCRCGGRGCLEQYAGEAAVLHAAGVVAPAGAGVELLRRSASDGDRAVLEALCGAGSALGIALTATVQLLDPQAVVLGGALAELATWLAPAAEEELRRRLQLPRSRLVVSRLGRSGPLLGAAHSVVRAVLDDPLASGAPAG
ncbi:ROK family transcriptional regulator [Streptomyces meridianus]|uniref:ROK family transcriptional regulator n=1 Tax=Streptomyces meridianus TaxID=2938945 RepID=A0ABT0XB90_9ACTN|nr:ROK family transcriptional regulator [Streptomyces meridianus]MCM2579570.1 ROK family transcriptional regulator [Streptomyces meridianus]